MNRIGMNACGLLLGTSSVAMVLWRLTEDPKYLQLLERVIQKNIDIDCLELMWAEPGTMLAALSLYHDTQDPQWLDRAQQLMDYL